MSKLSIPIKAFQFPKACKKPLQDPEESPLKKPKRHHARFHTEQSAKNTTNTNHSYHFISITTQSKLSISNSETCFANTFPYPAKSPTKTSKLSKKLYKKYRFSLNSENLANNSLKKPNLPLSNQTKFKRVLSHTKSFDLNESFTIVKQSLKPLLKDLKKTEDLFIKTKPKKKIHAWIPQTQSLMNLKDVGF